MVCRLSKDGSEFGATIELTLVYLASTNKIAEAVTKAEDAILKINRPIPALPTMDAQDAFISNIAPTAMWEPLLAKLQRLVVTVDTLAEVSPSLLAHTVAEVNIDPPVCKYGVELAFG